MPISYHEKANEFHLYNEKISYIITVLKNGQLGQLYYGAGIADREDFSYLLELNPRSMAACAYPGDLTFTMEHIKQEYPSYGHGDMRNPAYEICQENGSRITEFVYKSHRIYDGKRRLSGLPATYTESEEEAQTLEICMEDKVIETKLFLSYTIYTDYNVVTRNARFEHEGAQSVTLTSAMSGNVDLPDADFEMIELTGAWSRERAVKTRKLAHGVQSIYSMRGCSSNNYNPFLALKRPNADENQGEVYGFSLVYSGNFLAQVEVDTYDVSRVMLGIHPDGFSWPLKKGEHFQTPEVVLVYSEKGLNGMSQTFHKLYQKRLAKGIWRDRVRPVLINNWEATYFDFDEEKILAIARTAKRLGMELFVLDDGWFGKRDDDTSSLGDWYADTRKLPDGITGIAKKITDMGLSFGLWFEPEMVSKKSELYRKHPDWMLATPDRESSHGRNQFVLDFSREEVVDSIYAMMEKILMEADISYIKWDMNRCMTEVYSAGGDARYQGQVMHRYILGVYRLYEKLTSRFPDILFESCASGGARFDPGMLYYAPQCWTSDDTDAIERLKIQYGTSFVYPLSSMGSHVSAVPNHQLLRNTPLSMRANVAYFGTFGYELDLNKLSQAEQQMVAEQITFMKEYRELLQYGTFYRLQSPFEGSKTETAWMVVSEDKKEALVGYYRALQEVNAGYRRQRLSGLLSDCVYEVSLAGAGQEVPVGTRGGDELMKLGLSLTDASCGENKEQYTGSNGDYQSRLYHIKAIS